MLLGRWWLQTGFTVYVHGRHLSINVWSLFHRGGVTSDEYSIIDEQNNCLVDIDMRFE